MPIEQQRDLYQQTQAILRSVRQQLIQSRRSLTTQELLNVIEMEMSHATR